MGNEGHNIVDVVITIATDTRLSAAVDLGYHSEIIGFRTPAGLDGTVFTLHVSNTLAGTYVPVVDGAGAPIEITGAAVDEAIALTQDLRSQFGRWRFVRIRTTTAQAANRTFQIIARA